MKRIFTLLFLFLIAAADVSAQTAKAEKAEMLMIDENYDAAAELYKELVAENPTDPDLQFNMGFCLMKSTNGRFEAAEHLKRAAEGYEKMSEGNENLFAAYYYLAEAYHINYQFDLAIETYNKILEQTEDKKVKKTVRRSMETSERALRFFNNPNELVVTKLGGVNSEYTDHSPVITGDESVMIFTSRRPGGTGNATTESGKLFEDVYIYDKRKGIHAKPENIGRPINTKWHEATCGLSVDGQEMLLYRSTGDTDGNVFYSKLEGKKWTEPRKLGSDINSKGRETHACLSADGKQLYFTSNRKGGEGGYDIYVSNKLASGEWGKAENLGKTINTEFDEEGAYIHPDGKTLFFSSTGHPGMGGFDIFVSEKDENGKWSTPKNLGFPLNTVDNDVFYVPTADGTRGYYASESGGSSNIYLARLYNQKEKILTLVSGKFKDSYEHFRRYDIEDCKIIGDTSVLPGNRVLYADKSYFQGDSVVTTNRKIETKEVLIYDSIYQVPVDAEIYVLDTDTKQLENTYAPNSVTGEYLFVLNERKNYKIYFEAENYIFDTKDIPLKNDSTYRKIYYEAETDTIIPGKVRKSKKIGFDPGLVKLNKYTSLELDLLAYFLKKHPNLMVNISGYDYLFDDSDRRFFRLEYEYAEKRKEKVKEYLVNKGVNPQNIYTDMFPADIVGDTLEYTIFDKIVLAEAEKEKQERRKYFSEVITAANLKEEEIFELYKNDSTMQAVKTVFVSDMMFDYNKYRTRAYDHNLNELAGYLKENPDALIEIQGHTDETGSVNYNAALSKRRANFVKTKLTNSGAKPEQVKIKGFGEKTPIARNKTEDGVYNRKSMAYNRRIEIKVIKQGSNSKLYIKRIKVPQKYSLREADKEEVAAENIPKVYAISLMVTDERKDLDDFTEFKNVHEKQYPNGNFMYFFGNYTDEDKLLDDYQAAKTFYPDAFIFLKQ